MSKAIIERLQSIGLPSEITAQIVHPEEGVVHKSSSRIQQIKDSILSIEETHKIIKLYEYSMRDDAPSWLRHICISVASQIDVLLDIPEKLINSIYSIEMLLSLSDNMGDMDEN